MLALACRSASSSLSVPRRLFSSTAVSRSGAGEGPSAWPSSAEPEFIPAECITIEIMSDDHHHHHSVQPDGHSNAGPSSQQFSSSSSGGSAAPVFQGDVEEVAAASAGASSCGSGGGDDGVPSASSTFGRGASGSGPGSGQQHRGAASTYGQPEYTDVTVIDAFAKGRLTNFIRRQQQEAKGSSGGGGGSIGGAPSLFTVTQEATPCGRHRCFRCTIRLPLPHPHRVYVAEGLAENEKDAEYLAAMHGERVVDALGLQLFRLPAMQLKHAETARRAGRYAPLPTDGVKPEGAVVPPPLRMVTWKDSDGVRHSSATSSSSTNGKNGWASGSSSSSSATDGSGAAGASGGYMWSARRVVLEAEVVEPSSSTAAAATGGAGQAQDKNTNPSAPSSSSSPAAAAPAGQDAEPSGSLTGSTDGDDGADADTTAANADAAPGRSAYADTANYPWLHHHHVSAIPPSSLAGPASSSPSASTPMSSRGSMLFDPTEGGQWQLVNAMSSRFSPSDVALLLPCVLDRPAQTRIEDWLLHRDGVLLKDRVSLRHVAPAAGFSARMFVAEINLNGLAVAKGKASDKEMATVLACMHAELIIDALGLPLFLKDPAKQNKHALDVAGFGRWACSAGGDAAMTAGGGDSSGSHKRALPHPLKQQIGGDEVWLDPAAHRQHKSPSERLVQAHNDVGNAVSDFIEVLPRQELLTEARALLSHWQKHVALNPSPELYVCTRMGDYVRASVLLPVPRVFGIRGGNAVGRTVEQAKDLCALHALDVLCMLGLPLTLDPVKQAELMARRRAEGGLMTTADAVVPVWTHPASSSSSSASGSSSSPSASGNPQQQAAAASVPYGSSWTSTQLRAARTCKAPGYFSEGTLIRPLPTAKDIRTTVAVHSNQAKHFDLLTSPASPGGAVSSGATGAAGSGGGSASPKGMSEELIIAHGNDIRAALAYYFRRMNGGVEKPFTPSIFITGYGRQAAVCNVAFLQVPLPTAAELAPYQLSHPHATVNVTALPAEMAEREAVEAQAALAAVAEGTLAAVGAAASGPPAIATDADAPLPVSPSDSTPAGAAVAAGLDTSSSSASVSWPPYLLAIGTSLKKKDAERACFIHAARLLAALGVDIDKEKTLFLTKKKVPPPAPQPKKKAPGPAAPAAASAGQPLPPPKGAGAGVPPVTPPAAVNPAGATPPAPADATPPATATAPAETTPAPAQPPGDDAAASGPSSERSPPTRITATLPRPLIHPLLFNHLANAATTYTGKTAEQKSEEAKWKLVR